MSDLRGYYDQSYPPWVFTPGPVPAVTTLAPSSIVVDTPTLVTVTGTGFTPQSKVAVDGVRQSTTFVSATSLTYTAEADEAGAQDVRVVDQFGQVSNAASLTVTATAGLNLPADPGSSTIAVIQEWVDVNPDQADEVLAAEQARGDAARVTLVDWLTSFIATRDGTGP